MSVTLLWTFKLLQLSYYNEIFRDLPLSIIYNKDLQMWHAALIDGPLKLSIVILFNH